MFDENNNPVGKSKKAATKGITQVVISRITMAAPGMSEFTSPFGINNKWRNVNLYMFMYMYTYMKHTG